MADRVGQQLGNYHLICPLGRGGFAEVYLGEHVYLKTMAAIKVLHTQLAGDDMEDFLTEARTIANLVHPNIVRVLEFGLEGNTPFLVMDYASYGTLRQRHPKGSRLLLPDIILYVKQIADALQYAHEEKLIHRDIKPENMLVGRRNEVLLSDFGIALIAQSSRYQSTQDIVGTVAYMSPEQIQGKPRPASDQYSLGIVAYEWLSGDRPFRGSFTELCAQHVMAPPPPLHEKVPTILPVVEQTVMTALSKDPKQRFTSVQAFANALEQASQAEQPTFMKPQFSQIPIPPPSTTLRSAASPPRPLALDPTRPPTPSIDSEQNVPAKMSSSSERSVTSSPLSPVPPVKKPDPASPILAPRTRLARLSSSTPPKKVKKTLIKGENGPRPSQVSLQPPRDSRFPLVLSAIAVLVILSVIYAGFFGTKLILHGTPATPTPKTIETQADSNGLMKTATALSQRSTLTPQQIYDTVLRNNPTYLTNAYSNDLQWDQNSSCMFANGGNYQISNTVPDQYAPCMAKNTNLKNFAYQVQMTISNDGGLGGLIFRADTALKNFYRFSLDSQGTYHLFVCKPCADYSPSAGFSLNERSISDIAKPSRQTNILTLIMVNASIYLYVNHLFVLKFDDSTITSSGEIGLYAYSANQNTTVTFSDVKVWKLPDNGKLQ